MSTRRTTRIALALLSISAVFITAGVAQTGTQTTAAPRPGAIYPKAPAHIAQPRLEIFAGYSYLYPNTTASGLLPNGVLPVSSCLCDIKKGAGASITVPIAGGFGVTVDSSGHFGGQGNTSAQRAGHADAYNIAAGPQFKLRNHHIQPFAEALFGVDRLAPSQFHPDNSFGLLAGGGVDLAINHHIAARLVQADFIHANHQFGPSQTVAATHLRGLRLQAGLVVSFGGSAPRVAPVAAAPVIAPAIAQPAPVIAAPVDVVTLTAAASPAAILAGEQSTITANGLSAQGRPLTYNFSTNQGTLAVNNNVAILSTAGLGAGAALVTVNVANDLGQSATQNVAVNMTVHPVTSPLTVNLGSIAFNRDLRRPARVDNEAKALLDATALNLQRSADSTLALIGNAAATESHRTSLAAQRAVNTKAYLVGEKGIDARRITLYTGTNDSKVVTIIVIPAGATLDTTGITPVDEHLTKPQPRHSHHRRHHHHHSTPS
jgi:hypothetical protein